MIIIMRTGFAMKLKSSHFRCRMMILVLWALVVNGQSMKKCPEKCECSTVYHHKDGPTKKVECEVGGMRTLPVHQLERDIYQLIIVPPPYDPNYLTIGPVLTQPVPFSNLRNLTIINSNIPSIGQYSFWGLHKLIILNMSRNNLTNISMDNFRGLLNLTTLSLDHNCITHMASETFRHLESLARLSLSHNCITTLVPRLFRMLGKLEMLDLSFNSIGDLNPEIFKDIQNLIILKCRKCYLRRINVQIYHLAPHIEELDLGDNLFKFITDDDFSNLKKLKKLQFDRNEISVIVDNAFKGNGQLKYLDISHNRIALLAPESLNNLSNLSHLDISYNRLDKFNLQTFTTTSKSLRSIDFSGNRLPLNEIAPLLQSMPGIQDVGLANLSLMIIPANLFMYNNHLMSLDISSNLLTQFPHKLLTNTRYLQYLDISHNKISTLNDAHLSRLEGIAKLNLSFNTWNCDQCEMGAIFTYMDTTVLNESLREIQCHSPLQLRGVCFGDLAKQSPLSCFSSYEVQKGIVTGIMMVLMSVLGTAAIALYCTRRRSAQYYTNEQKRLECNHEHPDELQGSTTSGNVSTVTAPLQATQNSS